MNGHPTLSSKRNTTLFRHNLRLARGKWGPALSPAAKRDLRAYSEQLRMSIETGDLLLIDGKWYVTHSGLLRLATRKHCRGIEVSVVPQLCDPSCSRWAFKATVYKSSTCKGFDEHLPRQVRHELKQVGWSKATELVKVARSDGQHFESATWLHKARELPKEQFKQEVEKHLTGKETEAYELVTFKLYKSQLPVVEDALDVAGLMLGSDKSRGYCLEMICADFLAGAHADGNAADVLMRSMLRLFQLAPAEQQRQFLSQVHTAA